MALGEGKHVIIRDDLETSLEIDPAHIAPLLTKFFDKV
jgi:hypothetical protein